MPSILVIVFFLQLSIHIVNSFGVAAINNLLWQIYNLLPTPTSKSVAEQRQLKKQFLKLRQDLNTTSSQDEFAKWAKLRRQHDKVLEQLEKSKTSSESTKKTFDSVVSALRWLGTNGLRLLLQFWYTKQPMFWIPGGWIPYYAEWMLSFPRAPLGSISIQVWSVACLAIITLASDALIAAFALVAGFKVKSEKTNKGPAKVPGEKAKPESKKEL
ncbi:protein get1 [Bisporella sp. PMI_857]|nr:protein get1 [Bisporella sp. PMI_857]